MHFSSGINRPPYETADGYLQTTQGCSHNACLFCTYFKEPPFRKSPIEEIEADIKEMPRVFGAPKRIFLQGADGFAADYDTLMKTAELLRKYVPSVETIGGYARIDNFYDKTEEQLRCMAALLRNREDARFAEGLCTFFIVSCAGALITIPIGTNMMGITKVKIADLIPVLIFAPVLAWIAEAILH